MFSFLRPKPTSPPQRSPPAASVAQVSAALDAVAGKAGFRCVPVSWEDAQRGTVGGAVSCWGGNISDVRLWEKSGKLLYTLRSANWNERLGYVSSREVAVVVGNEQRGGGAATPVTLQRYLQNVGAHAAYAGVETADLCRAPVDDVVSIRFQTVFLPIAARETVEFCTETYNYNTRADDDPRNLLLLCTPQGTSVQQDGARAQRVYFHAVDPAGTAHRYWLEAERSEQKVGGAQVESAEEAAAAAARGKATAIRIGTRAMGTRFNVQLLVQVPLKQKPRPPPRQHIVYPPSSGYLFGAKKKASFSVSKPAAMVCDESDGDCLQLACAPPVPICAPPAMSASRHPCVMRRQNAPAIGVSNAARVSRGSEVDVYRGVANRRPERDDAQHITVTVTMYYTVAGGVPSAQDVEQAVQDLDALYKACASDKRLVDCTEVTAELTVAQTQQIATKLKTQPYVPAPQPPPVDNGFPE